MNKRQRRPTNHKEQPVYAPLLVISLHDSVGHVLDGGEYTEEDDDGEYGIEEFHRLTRIPSVH